METPVEPRRRRPGLAERTIARLLMRSARVTAASQLSDNFRLLDFHGAALKGVTWRPGEKVQIKLDNGLSTRTYTPAMWDSVEGKTQFLTYCHGNGPGSEWARNALAGDERYFFGPRSSLELGAVAAPIIFFGDETSFALAMALERHACGAQRRCVLEVNDLEEAASVADKVGLANATLIQRLADDAHLEEVSAAILTASQSSTVFVLSGKAPSIQRVRRSLLDAGIGRGRLHTKAYWAPGKVGLD